MLIRRAVLDAVAAGEVTAAFRRWQRPTVRPGTRLRTAVGVLEVGAVEAVEVASLTDDDARAAGHPDLAALHRENARREGTLYRVELRLAGPDPRVALREDDSLTDADRTSIATRLARLDTASGHGPWTGVTLEEIWRRPGVRAPDLAATLGRETASFKRDVRKLKELGLTESLEVGYRLSPRGQAWREGT